MTNVPAGLILVSDHGVYLMSNGLPRDVVNNERSRLSYAQGFNPDSLDFDEWWHNKESMLGGDDMAMVIPVDWVTPFIEKGKDIELWVENDGQGVTSYGI
jgi:hypothetical protein